MPAVRVVRFLLLMAAFTFAGSSALGAEWADRREAGRFLLHADFPLDEHPHLAGELTVLERDVTTALGVGPAGCDPLIPVPRQPVLSGVPQRVLPRRSRSAVRCSSRESSPAGYSRFRARRLKWTCGTRARTRCCTACSPRCRCGWTKGWPSISRFRWTNVLTTTRTGADCAGPRGSTACGRCGTWSSCVTCARWRKPNTARRGHGCTSCCTGRPRHTPCSCNISATCSRTTRPCAGRSPAPCGAGRRGPVSRAFPQLAVSLTTRACLAAGGPSSSRHAAVDAAWSRPRSACATAIVWPLAPARLQDINRGRYQLAHAISVFGGPVRHA